MKYKIINNYSGNWIEQQGEKKEVRSPLNNELLTMLAMSGKADLDEIIESAYPAQKKWQMQTLKKRAEVIYRYRNLLSIHREKLALISHEENGKLMEEAYAEVDKAIELCEFACSMPQLAQGEIEEVSKGVYCQSERKAIGVVGVIAPFNFPIMVPHWSVPNAIVLGNAVVIKPSELTPISVAYTAKLWEEAGLPKGVFNIYNGGKEAVEALCDHEAISGISFVGSTQIAKTVYQRATSHYKRCIALGGAKNYLIVLPDAHFEGTTNDILASATGMSGQRCMAASVMTIIEGSELFFERVVELFEKQKVEIDIPPLINKEAVNKITSYLDIAQAAGAKIVVDGRKKMNNNPCIIGSSIVDWRGVEDKMPDFEVFGPLLEVLGASSLVEALKYQNKSPYGNACTIFTQSGHSSQEFMNQAQAGMLGVNIGVPVPREPFSFGGIKASKFGCGDITGKQSIDFWTDLIKVTTKWNPKDKKDWMS